MEGMDSHVGAPESMVMDIAAGLLGTPPTAPEMAGGVETLALALVKAGFHDHRGILIHGSHADGTANAFSDVDVVVICEETSSKDQLKLLHRGLPFDITHMSKEGVSRRISADIAGRRPRLIFSIARSRILESKDAFTGDIIGFCQAAVRAPYTVKPNDTLKLRRVVSGLCLDILAPKDRTAALCIVPQLIASMLSLKALLLSGWIEQGRHAYAAAAGDGRFLTSLMAAARRAYDGQDLTDLCSMAATLVREAGGPTWRTLDS
ncbi:nucleotidyltransferase-like protein [Nitrospirillum amazonense]|uniref:Nucleotidyltransferase-like protein n=1 Tax=Nitrospirillum amazonense TaxID=28077 RepID=A0A560EK03_9PROT|nr:nucleotidyltransferase domain-containing protein [Nitrospirillum amazonense]TWB09674.1 nucleotidyltransferase-like protein [Nitrospirillum amazonense]